ncbi:hypothetical protein O987_12530 [Comamonas testosteroni TK102]|uniref:Uncharacterized protein n=1 Tax=Comamonas testosteroni TK102 TaxID=1392005 RepID=A0A076PIM6_COMTE|nr:hypothetical protein O987_12530 [Comamonas testosteroni TK102]
MHTLAFVQAERAGPPGPKASGVKAGWPRFGTKRGAQPANPTAARRDVSIGIKGKQRIGEAAALEHAMLI